MEHLIEKNVKQIIRIGSRSNSEILQELTLAHVGGQIDRTATEKTLHYEYKNDVERSLKELNRLVGDYSRAESMPTIKDYLMNHKPEAFDQLFKSEVDEDGYELVTYGSKNAVQRWLGSSDGIRIGRHIRGIRSIDELQDRSIHTLSQSERYRLYHHWVEEIKDGVQRDIDNQLYEYLEARRNFDMIRQEADLRCLQQAHIIGVTTSGLARIVSLSERVHSKVMICEEAGEVLEAHTLSTFLPSIEHAIFIGDQQQLRPQTQNYDLKVESPQGRQYSFDISLFERLIDGQGNGAPILPYTTIQLQRRMHPSISALIRSISYPDIEDDFTVEDYPEVVGMRQRLFWFNHGHSEAGVSKDVILATSYSNTFEVEMTAALVTHLISQGVYSSRDIAVLTPYLGQLRKIRERLSRSFAININERDQADLDNDEEEVGEKEGGGNSNSIQSTSLLRAVRLATVDNFQGEEAKVVIISLVRCNEARECGFLKISNRINVLLSRAQHGMYIIGNKATYGHVDLWDQVISLMVEKDQFGTAFQLSCPRHPDAQILAKTSDDFVVLSPEGGYNFTCSPRLGCGHKCPQKCHSKMLHDAVKCLEFCPRAVPGCEAHPCPKYCGDACSLRCRVSCSDIVLLCGHIQTLQCWQTKDFDSARCLKTVQYTQKDCGYNIEVSCYQLKTSSEISCGTTCGEYLPCGHDCKRRCEGC